MNFQKTLLEISQSLVAEQVKALGFLCSDLLHYNLTQEEHATNLFNCLTRHGLLTAEHSHLLTELLLIIGQRALVRTHQLPQPTNQISEKLLYNFSQSITDGNLRDMKFLLHQKLPENKLERATTLQVFREMENADLLSSTDFSMLKSIFDSVYPALNKKIEDYKAKQAVDRRPVAEENGPKDNMHSGALWNRTGGPVLDGPNGTQVGDMVCGKVEPLAIEEEGSGAFKVVHEEMEKSRPALSQVLPSYPMTSKKRGTCMIINNENFMTMKKREGTTMDEECAFAVFEWLNFDVEVYRDCDRRRILSIIKETAAEDHSQVDSLVCMVFSHGDEGRVFGVDGRAVMLQELKAPFTGSRCRSLAGKPKMFFIQACQGKKNNHPVTIEADSDAVKPPTIPSESDFLLAKSTVPTFYSYRNVEQGSWFIQSLCQHLLTLVPREVDLLSVMTKVSDDVSLKSDPSGLKKQMPNIDSSLRRNVVFPIPQAPAPELPAADS
ncbi:caspase-8-like isoform X2 [Synchiropus splendidus]|uniref:caspase-8-like isoform X2 n=1 Tax=Synchiropus splendidus TaxID=270530 RepID=UPI00237EB9DA|nr:caspase-8-like isoform X2 [Synchiropus splendidus]